MQAILKGFFTYSLSKWGTNSLKKKHFLKIFKNLVQFLPFQRFSFVIYVFDLWCCIWFHIQTRFLIKQSLLFKILKRTWLQFINFVFSETKIDLANAIGIVTNIFVWILIVSWMFFFFRSLGNGSVIMGTKKLSNFTWKNAWTKVFAYKQKFKLKLVLRMFLSATQVWALQFL